MLILDQNKSIKFNINGYEFPHAEPSKEEFNHDANWLHIEIAYCNKNTNKTYTDNCLLTYELSDLIDAFQQIITGDENSYISDFMEPYLSFCITKTDGFIIFVISFVNDTTGEKWSKIGATAKWTMEEAKEKVKELKDMELKFPER